MSVSSNPRPVPDGARPASAWRELLLVACATVLVYVVAAAFQLREWLTEASAPLERYQIDEIPFVVGALAISLAWFAWRRWRHADRELALRLRTERSLMQREQQYRTLFMEDLAGSAVMSADGVIRLCNPAMAGILGLGGAQEAIGRTLGDFYGDRPIWDEHLAQVRAGTRVAAAGVELDAAGRRVHVIARIFPADTLDDDAGLHAYFVDVTALQTIQRELAESLAQNRGLSQKYLMVQEEERRSLARELHDEMGQCLNAIKLDAMAIRDNARDRDPDLEENANAIVELSTHVYDVARGIMQRLRPAALDALGLRDAVDQLLGQWQRRNRGVQYRLHVQGDLDGLGEVINITVYRLVQECLTNVARHAEARHVDVKLERASPDALVVRVHDDGRGMDPNVKRTGLGLVGLRERVEALAGTLTLDTGPGAGTQLVVRLPIAGCARPMDETQAGRQRPMPEVTNGCE